MIRNVSVRKLDSEPFSRPSVNISSSWLPHLDCTNGSCIVFPLPCKYGKTSSFCTELTDAKFCSGDGCTKFSIVVSFFWNLTLSLAYSQYSRFGTLIGRHAPASRFAWINSIPKSSFARSDLKASVSYFPSRVGPNSIFAVSTFVFRFCLHCVISLRCKRSGKTWCTVLSYWSSADKLSYRSMLDSWLRFVLAAMLAFRFSFFGRAAIAAADFVAVWLSANGMTFLFLIAS
jgi:hypothetical protein